jgi:hypothetical protein
MYDDILSAKLTPVTTPSIPLVRMSRRLVGASEQSIDSDRRRVEDSIGMTGDWRKRGPVFEIGYGTMYTPAVKNLIAAGRIISVTDELWDVTRVIPPCAVTGQAAGTAAALTDEFPALDIKTLQAALSADGVKLHSGA